MSAASETLFERLIRLIEDNTRVVTDMRRTVQDLVLELEANPTSKASAQHVATSARDYNYFSDLDEKLAHVSQGSVARSAPGGFTTGHVPE